MKRIILLSSLILFISASYQNGPWTDLYIRGNTSCSSELDAVDPFEVGQGPYGAHNMEDNNLSTAWVEGIKGYGAGEYFFIGLGSEMPGTIKIANGYQKSESLFLKNSRVKEARISIYAGFFIEGDVTEIADIFRIRKIGADSVINLKDEMGFQEIQIPVLSDYALNARIDYTTDFKKDFEENIAMARKYCSACNPVFRSQYFLKFEIIDTYPGSSWDDTCISEIIVEPGDPLPVSEKENVINVYDVDDGGRIMFDTDVRTGLELVDMKKLKEYSESGEGVEMWITLMDVSPDKEWAQVDYMFSSVGNRVEEYSVLYNVRRRLGVDEDILGVRYGMYGFTEQEGKIWLDTADGLIDLYEIKKKLGAKY